ncbi:20048_t:CDS:2, partial [Racocetra persica]
IPKNDAKKWHNLKEKTVWGNEITSTSRVAKMNMILAGDGHNNIQRTNSLKNPASNRYDIVITNMPFSLKGPFDEYRDNYCLGKANVILYLTAPKERKQKEIWHFTVKNDGFTENKREEKGGENDFDIFWKFKDHSEEEKLKNGFQKLEVEEIKKNYFVSIPGLYKKFDFTKSKHETIPLQELIEEVIILRKDADFPLWSVTKQDNFVPQKERFKERIASKDTSGYKLVPPKHFAYRPPGVNVGYICYNNKEMTGCITAYYPVFKVKNEEEIVPEYLFCVCQSEKFREQADAFFRGTARPSINFTDFSRRIGDLCLVNPPKSEAKEKSNIDVSFLPMEDCEEYSLYVHPQKIKRIKEIYQGYTYFREDDLLIAKITPCFENGKMNIVKNLINGVGFGKNYMTGTTGRQRLRQEFIENYSILLPPLEIQEKSKKDICKIFDDNTIPEEIRRSSAAKAEQIQNFQNYLTQGTSYLLLFLKEEIQEQVKALNAELQVQKVEQALEQIRQEKTTAKQPEEAT